LLTLLWGVWMKQEAPPAPPAPGLTSFALDSLNGTAGADRTFLHAAGFAVFARRAIRFDMLERLEDELEQALATGIDADTLLTKLVSLLGSGKEEARAVLTDLGWRAVEVADAKPVWRKVKEGRRSGHRDKPRTDETPPNPNSPFAGLAVLRAR
jgi:hypothetical protein